MAALNVQRENTSAPEERIAADDHVFLPRDIVVDPGTINGIPAGDKWWLLQIKKAHPSSRTKSASNVFGFWLDEHHDQQNEDGSARHFRLSSEPVKVYYGSIIKQDELPLLIPNDKLHSGWREGAILYSFDSEYCAHIDCISDKYRKSLDKSTSDPAESDDSDNEEDLPEETITEVQLVEHQNELQII